MMLPTSRKVLEKLVAGRLARLAEMQGSDGLYPLQGGFRRGLGVERQLVLAQVAILDARDRGISRRLVGLDLVKAFDRIPKEFAAHCGAGYLREFCPRLASLVARLALVPYEAQVGSHKFAVSTGVPQGGILSPWLFVMAMNDLSLRLGGAGGCVVNGQELGTLLYADDILLADDSMDSSESRCRLAKEWAEEWGGAIHPAKTQWLDINATNSPPPGVHGGTGQGGVIDFLGVILTPQGVKPKVGPEVFADMLRAVSSTMEPRGLAPAPALQTLRSVAWAKAAHGAVVTLPCGAALTNKWLAAARQVLCTFKQVHRAEMVRELGLLYHPVAWLCRGVIRFYGTALTTDKDPVLKQVLRSSGHLLRTGLESALTPSGVTWEELGTVPVPDLLRKADGRIREWSRGHVLGEAQRLQLNQGEAAPLWREWSDGPRKYLYEVNARYGFMFRRGSFAPTDLETAACYFCGRPGGDWGRHVLYCDAGRAEVPLPEKLRLLSPESLDEALLLEDATPKDCLRAALGYMQDLYQARALRRRRAPQPEVKRNHSSNPEFFRSGRRPAVARRSAPKRRVEDASLDSVERGVAGTAPAPKRRRRLQARPPTPEQLVVEAGEEVEEVPRDYLILLDEPCHELILSPRDFPCLQGEPLELSRKRALERTQYNSPPAKRVQPGPLPLAVTQPPLALVQSTQPVPQNEGPWTREEEDQLARAALLIGSSSPAALAPYVPSRTIRQIKERLKTGAFRRSVDVLRRAQNGSPPQGASEPPATAVVEPLEEATVALQPLEPANPGSTPPSTCSAVEHKKGRWTPQELHLLHAAIRAHGCDVSGEVLSRHVGTRSALQCSDRMREKTTREFIASLSLPPVAGEPTAAPSGRWDSPDIRRLEEAINRVGDFTAYGEVAALCGNRTSYQVAAKVQSLVRAGKLRQTSPGRFTIDA
jgi:hypothetical protein